jgi:hypothetical protein
MEPQVSFPENWPSPPELARALPREVRRSGRAIFLTTMAAVFLVAAIPLFVLTRTKFAQQEAQTVALRTAGREVTAEIARLWHTGKSSTPMVGYAFTAGGRRIQGESSVPEELWDGIRKAGFLPVRYLPADPHINHPLAWEEPAVPAWLPLVLPVIPVGGATVLLVILRRQAELAAEGQPAPGIVTGCSRTKGGWRVRYQFRTKEGAILKGSDRVHRRPEPGTSVCILYLQQNPRRNQIYPLWFYRVDR